MYRGLAKQVETFLNEHPEKLVGVEELALNLGVGYTESEDFPIAVANAANYLARNGRIHRTGVAGNFRYQALHKLSQGNPIEALLDALAEAEPHLRRLAKLWDVMSIEIRPQGE
jgi:hypothetical protein